jgi:DNA-binding MarR family transcriptional regulator
VGVTARNHHLDAALLAAIDVSWRERWTSPAVRELAALIGRTPSATHVRLVRLANEGRLERKRVSDRRVLYRVPRDHGE